MRFKIACLNLCLFFTMHQVVAQNKSPHNFVKGYILKPNGDTLKGQVDNAEWTDNPTSVRFRTDTKSEGKIYKFFEIMGFGILSPKVEHYQKAVIRYHNERLEEPDLPTYWSRDSMKTEINFKTDTVFLWTLARGAINLFEFRNKEMNRYHYFIQKEKGTIVELVDRKILVKYRGSVSEQSVLEKIDFQTYRSQLRTALAKCASLEKDIKALNFSRDYIVKLIGKYNDCTGSTEYIKSKEKVTASWTVMGGLTLPRFEVLNKYLNHKELRGLTLTLIGEKLKGSLGPSIGINYELKMLRTFHFGAELELASIRIYNTFAYNEPGSQRSVTLDAHLLSARLNAYGVYDFNNSLTFKPYLKGGLGFGYLIKNDCVQTAYESKTLVSSENIPLIKIDPSLFLSAGVRTRRVSIEARINLGYTNLLSGPPTFEGFRFDRLTLLGGYSF